MAPKKEDIERAWQTVFTGSDGKIVFTQIMMYLGFFDQTVPNAAAILKANIAKWMLKQMGIWKEKNITTIINTLIDRG